MHFCPKNILLSTFNFQLSTFYCTFASYFGIIWAFCKKIENIILNCQLSIVNYPFSCESREAYPYSFSVSQNAVVLPVKKEGEPFWINLYYPALNATIHCSYKPVRNNLRELTNDALEFVYRNASYATSIPEREYTHPEANVYGVLFDLEGNTASSCQFFITDSTRHFFRASVYCNCPPNADSLAPVYNYLRADIIKMVETFQWTK